MSDKPAAPAPDIYSTAVNHMRETAKWIITLFGGLGAVLIAGTQLSSIGKLTVNNDPLRIAAAIVGGAIALFAIGRIIWSATKVMASGEVTLAELERVEKASPSAPELDWIRDHELLADFDCIESLRTRRRNLFGMQSARITGNAVPGKPPVTEEELKKDEPIRRYLNIVATSVTSGARYYRVREQFLKTREDMFRYGAITAIAATLFIWGINPPADPPVEASAFKMPAVAQLKLTEAGKQVFEDILGNDCVMQAQIPVIVLSATTESFEIASIPSAECQTARFTVTDSIGSVTPATTVQVTATVTP